jgi:C1A family cysteine protease
MNRRFVNYGWLPDLPDQRDFRYSASAAVLNKLPRKIDLRKLCPPVYDQGQLGSCTSNAIAGAFEYGLGTQKAPDFMPSRLFIYYNERVIENSVSTDSGAMLRDGMKSVNNQGVCHEDHWPYIITEFAQKPHAACYAEALKHQVLSYHRVVRSLDDMKGCLSEGYPFVFGFTVYESFESDRVAKTGEVNMPKKTEHVVGYTGERKDILRCRINTLPTKTCPMISGPFDWWRRRPQRKRQGEGFPGNEGD